MREIKFKAWDKVLKRIVPVACLYFDENSKFIGIFTGEETDGEWTVVDKKHLELMQFSGQKDKNGNGIYEGYIIDCKIFGQEERGVVKYSDMLGAYFLTGLSRSDTELWASGERVIVGNIYEHPHLLESEDEL